MMIGNHVTTSIFMTQWPWPCMAWNIAIHQNLLPVNPFHRITAMHQVMSYHCICPCQNFVSKCLSLGPWLFGCCRNENGCTAPIAPETGKSWIAPTIVCGRMFSRWQKCCSSLYPIGVDFFGGGGIGIGLGGLERGWEGGGVQPYRLSLFQVTVNPCEQTSRQEGTMKVTSRNKEN